MNVRDRNIMVKKGLFVWTAIILLAGCASSIQDAYFNMWEKVGVEKREILVDRVESAQQSQQDAQIQFKSALEEFSGLIGFDGGELEELYLELSDQYEASASAAAQVSARIDKVESVADSLFREWESELTQISNDRLRRDSQRKLSATKRKYDRLINAMRKVETSTLPVLQALQDNVLYLKHNLNANAIDALQDELTTIRNDVTTLIAEMTLAIRESDEFIQTIQGN